MKIATLSEYMIQMKQLHGNEITNWKVKCVKCGTVQSVQDFLDTGMTLQEASGYFGFSCIGRYNGEDEKGCDWTLGGLLAIHTLMVVGDDGKPYPRFEIAPKVNKEDIKTQGVKDEK